MSDSFEMIATPRAFALHGLLQVDFAAAVQVIDPGVGLVVQLDGVDFSLDEQTPSDAMGDNPLLVFIDDEIFAVFAWTLLGNNLYQLLTIRGRYASEVQDHAAGADVFIVNKSNLALVQHPQFAPNNVAELKAVPISLQRSGDPGDVAPVNLALAGRALALPAPINLMANAVSQNPSYHASADVVFTWDQTELGGDWEQPGLLAVDTLLTFLDTDANVLGVASVSGLTVTYTYAALTGLLGGAIDFVLQAQFRTTGPWFELLSDPAQLLVTHE
ncbi:MAG TPA: hypothetical protein VHB20_14725 [Verrucomicrobiae bacterium]|jgi:hypothetical protein|nr:hypothetical protein [Verrucomicrobiae bacterium]